MSTTSFRANYARLPILAALNVVLAVSVMLSGCGEDTIVAGESADRPAVDSTENAPTGAARAVVEFRPILSRSQPGSAVTTIGGSPGSGPDASGSAEPVGPEGGLAATDSRDGVRYLLGPLVIDNSAIESATAELSQAGQWEVDLVLLEGPLGIDKFNAAAQRCFDATQECPDLGEGRGQIAIVVDGAVISAPTINVPAFGREAIGVSGVFDADSAEALARAMTSN